MHGGSKLLNYDTSRNQGVGYTHTFSSSPQLHASGFFNFRSIEKTSNPPEQTPERRIMPKLGSFSRPIVCSVLNPTPAVGSCVDSSL